MTRRRTPTPTSAVPVHTFTPDLIGLCAHDNCGHPADHRLHTHPTAATMNATGSPTGRVRTDAPQTSRDAAVATGARGHRQTVLTALLAAGTRGLTSIEAAALLPPRRDQLPQPPNIAAARLGELWETGQATIARTWGICVLGVCHPHHKPDTIHRPTAACDVHGPAQTRSGASIWVAVAHTPGHRA